MPLVNETTTPQHQVLINQSIIKRINEKVEEIKKDVDDIKSSIAYIKKYTEQKEDRESKKWF
tara:strand:- start:384 stop:569 length:186 start_codon:yes stop_codon:yes gene_type:complete